MAVEQWQIDNRRAAGWSDAEITEWLASATSKVGNQSGSQFWVNNNYQGAEPDYETKKAFSSADYARDWITGYANVLSNAGVPVSGAVAAITKNPITTNPGQMWEKYPDVGPVVAAAARYPSLVTAHPEVFNDPTSPLAPVSPVSGAGAGTVDTLQAEVNPTPSSQLAALDYRLDYSGLGGSSGTGSDTGSGTSILSSALLIPGLIIACLFLVLIFMTSRGHSGGVSA